LQRPGFPNANDAQELRVEPTIHPISPPIRMPQPQEQFDPSDVSELPPPRPARDPRRSSHRRELAQFRPGSAQPDAASSPMTTPDSVSDPGRIEMMVPSPEVRPHHTSTLADIREVTDRDTSLFPSHRPPTSTIYDTTFKSEPQPWLRSKGMPRPKRGIPPLTLPPPSFRMNHSVYHLPNARSPPSIPRADQTLVRHQD
jgi:hypothetical protein